MVNSSIHGSSVEFIKDYLELLIKCKCDINVIDTVAQDKSVLQQKSLNEHIHP